MSELPFHVEIWSEDFEPPKETVAKVSSMSLAKAVFDELVKTDDTRFIMISIGIRCVMKSPELQKTNVVSFDPESH